MLTWRQLACFTSSKYPADLFVQNKNKKTGQTRTASSKEKEEWKRHSEILLCTLLVTSSPHFHLKLSAEAGAMFVSVLIVELESFPLNLSLSLSLSDWNRPEKRKCNKPPLQPLRQREQANKEPLLVNPFKVKDTLMANPWQRKSYNGWISELKKTVWRFNFMQPKSGICIAYVTFLFF